MKVVFCQDMTNDQELQNQEIITIFVLVFLINALCIVIASNNVAILTIPGALWRSTYQFVPF
jgi:hypothetical protein